MANTRYLIHRQISPAKPSLIFCTACGLFLQAGTLSFAADSKTSAPIAELPDAPIALRSRITKPPGSRTGSSAVKSTTKPAAKSTAFSALRDKPKKATTISTSGASRLVARQAGSLQLMSPEKPGVSRTALTSPRGPAQMRTLPADQPAIVVQISKAAEIAATQSDDAPELKTVSFVTESEDQAKEETRIAAAATEPAGEPGAAAAEDETASGPTEPLVGTFRVPSTVSTTNQAATPDASTSDASNSSADASNPSTPATTAAGADGAAQPPRLYAPRISYDRGTIIAEGEEGTPVRLESTNARIFANRVVLDTEAQTVRAQGQVRVERDVTANRYQAFRPSVLKETQKERITETLTGNNFEYNFGTRQGKLDQTQVRLADFNISAEQLIINGQRYIARNVIIRPGGLSEEELKIYGTPPFNLRAKEVIVDYSQPAPSGSKVVGDTAKQTEPPRNTGPRTEVRSASLYFRNLRLLPVPSALLRRRGGRREETTYQITPRIYYNSADGLLLTARLEFPLIRPDVESDGSRQRPSTLDLNADVGLSTRVGFRGGAELQSESRFGRLSLGARVNDVISAELTDRIELDRLPELQYSPPALRLFTLPGGRQAGLQVGFIAGSYRERFTDQRRAVDDTMLQSQIRLTTRMSREDGPYLDLFSRASFYGDHPDNQKTIGFEAGYTGRLGSRISGQWSVSMQNVSGSTPFEFDDVEIKREFRSTFDVLLTPRWIIPVDLRYDLQKKELRDKTFGLLRNYKTFAYGVVYQTARRELRLEIRQGF